MFVSRTSDYLFMTFIGVAFVGAAFAQEKVFDLEAATATKKTGRQEILELEVLILDEATDEPLKGAKVIPWALRSSQGHGHWKTNDDAAGMDPQPTVSGDDGHATVRYPKFRYIDDLIKTTSVSLKVDHPAYGFENDLHIDVPLEGPRYEVKLKKGVRCEIRPSINGTAAKVDDIFAVWSDGRSYEPGAIEREPGDWLLRFPAMRQGANSLMLIKLKENRVTHFSKLTEFELSEGEPLSLDMPLEPVRKVEGMLSENVDRPVKNGYVVLETLPPRAGEYDRVMWFSHFPIRPDGTFTIDAWPRHEKLQLIARCDGFVATSGEPPEEVTPRNGPDPFLRPQVFDTDQDAITVAMTPMAKCKVTLVDEDDEPVAGIKVVSWPNVCWWNGGSQVYAYPLLKAESILRDRDINSALTAAYKESHQPFAALSDGDGVATLSLPVGSRTLTIASDVFELPVFLGRRITKVNLETANETVETRLVLQPKGTEKLGDWDKLAGVVFGCSTREGRRICALPEVRKKMDEFTQRFRDGKSQRDPKLLAEAYSLVADAFADVGDEAESMKWRRKAAQQRTSTKQ